MLKQISYHHFDPLYTQSVQNNFGIQCIFKLSHLHFISFNYKKFRTCFKVLEAISNLKDSSVISKFAIPKSAVKATTQSPIFASTHNVLTHLSSVFKKIVLDVDKENIENAQKCNQTPSPNCQKKKLTNKLSFSKLFVASRMLSWNKYVVTVGQ